MTDDDFHTVLDLQEAASRTSGMNYVVQYSGGIGSFAAAVEMVVDYPGEVTLLFCDTKTEDEDLYRFLRDTEKFLGVPITTIADGRNVWELLKDRRIIANGRHDTCSETLKRNLAGSYIKKNFQVDETVLVFGIDWTEQHRVLGIVERWAPYRCYFPLLAGYDKQRFMVAMEAAGLVIPRLYGMGFPHNNCGGFCVKAGKAHFLNLLDKLPERYRYHEDKEAEMQAMLGPNPKTGQNYTILKETVKKEVRYISLRTLRERAEEERKTEGGQLDWGGCGCFA